MKTIIFLFFLIFSISAFSQNESGERKQIILHPKYTENYHYNRKVPILKIFPSSDSTLPIEVVNAYKYYEDLLKNDHKNYIDILSNVSLRRKNASDIDSIRYLWKCKYLIDDYDPIKSKQFSIETILDSGKSYHYNSYHFGYKISNTILELPNRRKRKILSLLEANYVLKVVIQKSYEIDSKDLNGYNSSQYECTIIDTLKGKIHASNFSENVYIDEKNSSRLEPINFSFVTSVPMEFIWHSAAPVLYEKSESLYRGNNGDFITFKTGDTAIVFLSFSYSFVPEKNYDKFILGIESNASNGALPVVNGMVKDINKVWSNELYLPYDEWKEKFEESKRFILDFEL
jgi:hypothetical protein